MSKIQEIEDLANTRNLELLTQAVQKIASLLRTIHERLDELEYDIDKLKKKVE